MTKKRILIINPNSNAVVTRGIDESVEHLRRPGRLEIGCQTLDDGPFGIETDDDIQAVLPLIVEQIGSQNDGYDAFVIACYSDPGLDESRSVSRKPVFGIQESALFLSASYERRFGVLALGRDSIQRHIAYVRSIGMQDFHAGERPLNVTVDEAASDPATLEKIVTVAQELIEEDGAETIILGCAGMAIHRHPAQDRLGVPVIDPVLAAVTMAGESV